MILPRICLSSASDPEIEAAVAEYCGGWVRYEFIRSLYIFPPWEAERHDEHPSIGFKRTDRKGKVQDPGKGFVDSSRPQRYPNIPSYLTDANVVLALLDDGWYWTSDNGARYEKGGKIYEVRYARLTGKEGVGKAPTFCRAATIALLKASGKVTVEE